MHNLPFTANPMLQTASAPAPVPAAGSMMARDALFVALAIVTLGYLVMLVRSLRQRAAAGDAIRPTLGMSVISFIANFFDTLGIGSYATTTSMVRQWKLIPDERIPGTLNVGYVIPTVIQAYIYTKLVPVDSTTLILMIVAAVLGAWLGAGVVSQWNRRKVQIGMGLALLGFAIIMIIRQTGEAPTGGAVLSLTGAKLAIGVAGNFVLGALMTLGIGLYAPCLILVGLLGMTETTAFPIMMGSCAFLMPFANVRFMRSNAYHAPSIMSMLLAGIPAVLIAAFLVTNLPLTVLKWLVVVVVIYTGTNMLRTARRERDLARDATAAEAQPAL
jgi:uncharacterized membrane protein YfcA